ncbi:DinB family protein [Pseudonocardia ailaonensis]|uniref:DinB family protein n=1 Tax=Pseudonocardia ailaonensis TaxID=367279 RepID=A0ABN2NME8_9PSEU
MRDPRSELLRYLRDGREVIVWKLEGLSEYDARRPLTPTGTNLLGLVKHLATMEVGYFGEVFDRPFPQPMPWIEEDAEPNADMWATAEESRAEILDLHARAVAHADATIAALALDAPGRVPWWTTPDVTLHRILVHMIAETHRHAGHADIVRELADGAAGHREAVSNLPDVDPVAHRERVEQTALRFRQG